MIEGPPAVDGPEKSVIDLLRGQGGGEGEIPPGQTFGDAQQVGGDVLVLAGEHPAGTAKAGSHLISDEQRRVAVAEVAQAAEMAGGRGDDSAGTLHERFDNDGGDTLGVLFEQAADLIGTGQAAIVGALVQRAAVAVWRWSEEGWEEQRPIGAVEEVDASDADGADGVAVVSVGQGDEAVTLGVAAVVPIGEGEFAGDLEAGGAVVGVEDFGEAGRSDFDQAAGEFDGRGRSQAELGTVRDLAELVDDGAVDFGSAMAVEVAPEAGVAVEVAPAVGVDEIFAFAADDQERVNAVPEFVLGEGVPDVTTVEVDETTLVGVGEDRFEMGFGHRW